MTTINKQAAIEAVRAALVAHEWPPQDGDRQIDDAIAALNALPAVTVTDDMVERVARALCTADGKDPDADFRNVGEYIKLSVATDKPQNWRTYARKAKAALEAALNPQ